MKLLFLFALLSQSQERATTLSELRSNHAPTDLSVQGGITTCTTAVTRVKEGPDLWEEIIAKNEKYTDSSFEGTDSLYWLATVDLSQLTIQDLLWKDQLQWKRLGEMYPSASLWTTNPSFVDSVQGFSGNCYFMASISALAEFPDLVKSAFLTPTANQAGIYAFRFYIRGKPWLVTIDDQVLAAGDNLVMGNVGPNTHLWGPLIDKAWAKIEGSYANAGAGGFFQMGIRALVGCPVFDYVNSEQGGEYEKVWNQIKSANTLNYIIGAGTVGVSDQELNSYGIALAHQYALIEAFTLTDTSGVVQHRMFMLRNPWGATQYKGAWKADDPAWTAHYISQVPHGVNPTTSDKQGIFIVEDKDFLSAFDDFQIAHYRDGEGYSSDVYDKEFDLDIYKTFTAELPKKEGDLYINVESYYRNMVPDSCLVWLRPWITFTAGIEGKDEANHELKLYMDQFAQPTMIPAASYEAGDKLKITVAWGWLFTPLETRDYTVSVYSAQDLVIRDGWGNPNVCNMDGSYPSCFTKSSYHVGGVSKIAEDDEKPRSLWEVYMWSYDWDSFWGILQENWWLALWWF